MGHFNSKCTSKTRLVGKTVIITGANSGIGKETARDLYRRGARVILACRDMKKARDALEDIKLNPPSRPDREQFQGDPGELAIYMLDLASLKSVRECAKNLLTNEPAIHILINNAGVVCVFEKTEDGFEAQLQTNYLSHFLLTLLLLSRIQSSGPGCRIVNVTSYLHIYGSIHFDDLNLENSYTALKAYAQTKLANALFAIELTRRLEEANIRGINVYFLHPGTIKTEITRHTDTALFPYATTMFSCCLGAFGKTPEQGAQTMIYCSVDEKSAEETGLYYEECHVVSTYEKAKDYLTAKNLWDETCRLLHLPLEENLAEFLKILPLE